MVINENSTLVKLIKTYLKNINVKLEIGDAINPNIDIIELLSKIEEFDKASELLNSVNIEEDTILLASDYDCDGLNSLVVGNKILSFLGYNIIPLHNHRVHGYGFNETFVSRIESELEKNPSIKLIITSDHGSGDKKALEELNKKCKVLLTDHHEVPENINVACFINPKYKKCNPNKLLPTEINGTCVLFLVLYYYLYKNFYKFGIEEDEVFETLMDLVGFHLSTSIISDIMDLSVPLNRMLYKHGIQHASSNTFLKQLIYNDPYAGGSILSHRFLSFVITPVINTGNRLNLENEAYSSLMGGVEAARDLPRLLSANNYRKNKSNIIYKNIREKLNNELYGKEKALIPFQYRKECDIRSVYTNDQIIVMELVIVENEFSDFNVGSALASRIADEYERACILFTSVVSSLEDPLPNQAHGSGRGYGGINILEVAKKAKPIRAGGHKEACGVEVMRKDLKRFATEVLKQKLTIEYTKPVVLPITYKDIDEDNDICDKFTNAMEPFGNRFPLPYFMIEVEIEKVNFLNNTIEIYVKKSNTQNADMGFKPKYKYYSVNNVICFRKNIKKDSNLGIKIEGCKKFDFNKRINYGLLKELPSVIILFTVLIEKGKSWFDIAELHYDENLTESIQLSYITI